MKSAKIVSPRKIEVTEENIPAVGDDKVLVRLQRAALCGSDLPYFSNSFNPASYPFPAGYPGHECMGVVEESKSGFYRPGDRVMYYPPRLDAYREYHVADPGRLQKLPANGDANILLMTQLLGAVSHCVFRLDSPYNKNVVVVGLGPVGLLFVSLLKNLSPRSITAVDILDYRLDTARRMGADHLVNPSKTKAVKAIGEITSGNMADIVIDAYGQESSVINTCFEFARHNGQVAFFGICLEEAPRLNFNEFFRKELRMVASVGPDLSIDYPFALSMIEKNAVDVSPLITHVMPFGDIQKAFDRAVSREDGVIKIVLEF